MNWRIFQLVVGYGLIFLRNGISAVKGRCLELRGGVPSGRLWFVRWGGWTARLGGGGGGRLARLIRCGHCGSESVLGVTVTFVFHPTGTEFVLERCLACLPGEMGRMQQRMLSLKSGLPAATVSDVPGSN